ncbi:MAG: group 1 truncated hemoglobin [Thermodesulfobacteriota bacterium]
MLKTQRHIRTLILVVLLAALPGAGPVAQAAEAQPASSLYDRLGGIYPIAVVVDTFIDLLFVNDVLNANPAIKEARERVPAAGLKYHVTALVCQETGGPCKYTGRGMAESHVHLNISEKEWQAMMADFRRVLNNYGVPGKEQQELIAIVESTRKDIVVRK